MLEYYRPIVTFTHAIIDFSDRLLENFSFTHPSPKYRFSLMESNLKDEFDMEDIRAILELLDERKVLDLRSDGPDIVIHNQDYLITEFDKLVNKSLKILEGKNLEKYTIDKYNHSVSLSKSLKANIPINSSRTLDDNELLRLCNSFKLRRLYRPFKKKDENIYSLLSKFEEKSNAASVIITAGWINKFKNTLPEFINIFFNGDDDFDKKYNNYRKILNRNDNTLLKSIETAYIHSLFEVGEKL